jgi:hypothetical protein
MDLADTRTLCCSTSGHGVQHDPTAVVRTPVGAENLVHAVGPGPFALGAGQA